MSKIALTPNPSGTGTLTVAAPNTNTDRTLTLPDVTTTLVGTDATQTLTNKSIAGSQLTGTVAGSLLTGTVASSLLTGALPAIDGSALTGLPAPTSAQVGTATAGLAYNAVGSYGFFMWNGATQQAPGTTVAGSSLYPANAFTQSGTAGYATVFGQPSGTWRLMGQTGYNNGTVVLSRNDQYISVFLRIS